MYIMQLKQFKPLKIPAVVGNFMIVGALTFCALFLSVCDLKATEINMRHGDLCFTSLNCIIMLRKQLKTFVFCVMKYIRSTHM